MSLLYWELRRAGIKNSGKGAEREKVVVTVNYTIEMVS